MQPRTKFFATAFLILLVLVIVSISVPAVRAAIQRWIGYVPGIGLVSEGQIRVLAEPVSITQEGVTLRLKQVLADSTQTTILYTVDGLTAGVLGHQSENPSLCNAYARLRFPEAEFEYGRESTSFGANGEGYQGQIYYPAIPATVNEATLVIPCIPSTLPGKVPENWELPFRLIPAPPELTAIPVIEISTPAEAPPTPLRQADPNANPLTQGISLVLDRAVQMDDGYLIYATLHWENTTFGGLEVLGYSTIRLLDASGQEVPQHLDFDASFAVPYEHGKTVIAVKTESTQVSGPLTLVVDAAHVNMGINASFTFDPGPNPQPGQVWELNQDIDLGHGYSLRVLRATYPENSPQPGFSFDMESDTGISAALLIDMEHPLAEGPGLSGNPFATTFSDDFYYAGAMPEGSITVNIESVAATLSGHWEAQWTPPAPEYQNTAVP